MGFFSGVCSAIGGFFSGVGSAISGICSAIGGALGLGSGGIGSVITSMLAPLVGLTIPGAIALIGAVCAIVSTVANMLGLKEKNETPEELGMKAEIADKKPEDFESTQEYINYLRKDVNIDKEKLNSLNDEQKLAYGLVGSSLYIKEISEKYNIEIPGEFWTTVAQLKMDGKEVKTFIDNFKSANISDMGDMVSIIKGRPLEDSKDRGHISDTMLSTLKELNPEMNENSLIEKYFNMKF